MIVLKCIKAPIEYFVSGSRFKSTYYAVQDIQFARSVEAQRGGLL